MTPDQYRYHKGFASKETRGGGRKKREKERKTKNKTKQKKTDTTQRLANEWSIKLGIESSGSS